MIASLSRQLPGGKATRIATGDSRSLQRDAERPDARLVLSHRPWVKRVFGVAAVAAWLLVPFCCLTLAPKLQVPVIFGLWSAMVFCLILCCSAKCSEPEHVQYERLQPPRLAEIWPSSYQDTKTVIFVLGLCSSMACILCLASGGVMMLSMLRSPGKEGCSVEELPRLGSEGLGSFRCEDGQLDVEHEGTILLRHGWSYDAAQVYRMAPVYLRKASAASALPVAWAVAKDRPLACAACSGGSCPHGLCGLLLRPSVEEAALLSKLAKELSETLGFDGQKDFHLSSMPLVALTDPSDPFGSRWILSWAVIFYLLALLTLGAFQLELSLLRGDDYEALATKSDTER